MLILAYLLFGIGASISILNFHLSFIRPIIHRLRQQEFRPISGFPLVGSLLLVASYFCFASDHPLRWAALFVALLDTGGVHWFCATMLWHARRRPM